jgi:predicted dehydrogenase
MPTTPDSTPNASRREFLSRSSALAASGAVAATFGALPAVHAQGSDAVNVALIGCGGRGSQAAINAMKADPGFDGYKRVLDSDVKVVLLCTTPHFRPLHLKAAIDAGKHVFCEKPVAVDAPGVRSVLKTCEEAKEKKLAVVSGLCWRYDLGVRETIKRIKEGAIGDIVAIQENYLTGTLWHRGTREEHPEWSEMEYQMRNWMYYTWLSGDHNVEQHIHSLDKALWLMDDKPPVAAYGMGGRQVRVEPKWGNIYDHHAVVYEWANGVRVYSFTRQMSGQKLFNQTEDIILGTKGQANVIKHEITPTGGETWRYRGDKPSMYDVEHVELFKSIKEGQPINNGQYMSYSTMLAILGRMCTYTGQRITWDEAMSSKLDMTPESYEWGPVKLPPEVLEVAMPGKTTLV